MSSGKRRKHIHLFYPEKSEYYVSLITAKHKRKKNRKSAIICQASYFVSLQKEYIQIDRQNNHNDNQRP